MPKLENEKLTPTTDAELMSAAAGRIIASLKAKLPFIKTQKERKGFELAIAALNEVLAAKVKQEVQTCQEEEKQEVGSATSAEQ